MPRSSARALSLNLLIALVSSTSFDFQIGSKGKRASLDRFDGTCNGMKGLKMITDITGVAYVNNMVYFNVTDTILEDMPWNDLQLRIKFMRCKSKENPDTCEQFYNMVIPLCDVLKKPTGIWASYLGAFKPPIKCPLKKGVYTATNSSIDVSAILLFPTSGFFWKCVAYTLAPAANFTIGCSLAETRVMVKRKN